jgi:hypothetical protein
MMVIDRDDIVVQQKNVRIYRGHSFSSRTERRYPVHATTFLVHMLRGQ